MVLAGAMMKRERLFDAFPNAAGLKQQASLRLARAVKPGARLHLHHDAAVDFALRHAGED